jgi:putative transposase
MQFVCELGNRIGLKSACAALGVARAQVYRMRAKREDPVVPTVRDSANDQNAQPRSNSSQPRALALCERQKILDILHSARFVDSAPRQVYATLLDEGIYYCSVRTMYRILQDCSEVKERRNQLRHPAYSKPELLATGPNQIWSWDITKLLGPAKWTYFYLYVILDIFSRYVVGWMLAERESAALAEKLISETSQRQEILPGQLTIHADRGSSMKSKPVALLLSDLGITKTHSRPHTSNDNPFSEAQFKTLKYRPDFPDRFGSPQDARAFCRFFFDWYNREHHHTGIALMTPENVHYGRAQQMHQSRIEVLKSAYRAHPERFVHKTPLPPALPKGVWINKPTTQTEEITTLISNELVSQKG